MPSFKFAALDEDNQAVHGTLEAEDRNAAMQALSQKYAVVTELEERLKKEFRLLPPRLTGDDRLNFTQTLATLLDGGVPLRKATDILRTDSDNPYFQTVLQDISNQLGSGASFSQALASRSHDFSAFYVNMVKAGETSGKLPEILTRLAEYTEKTEAIKAQTRAAMAYPLIVILFALALVAGILAFGIPQLRELYDGLGVALPAPTQFVVALGGVFADHLAIFAVLFLVALFLGYRAVNSDQGQAALDGLKLRVPPFAETFKLLYVARFASTLATLYIAGVPLLLALELTAGSLGNSMVGNSLLEAAGRLKEGKSLAGSLRGNPYFKDSVIGMVAAGEESGNLEKMLLKLADFYEAKTYAKLESLSSTVEPLLMIFVGIVIGGILITLGLPFVNLASVL